MSAKTLIGIKGKKRCEQEAEKEKDFEINFERILLEKFAIIRII